MIQALLRIDATKQAILESSARARAAIPMFASIDDFLLHYREQPIVAEICRLAIAECILVAESTSFIGLGLNDNPDYRGNCHMHASNTWIGKLMRGLVFNKSSPDVAIENLSFLTFNYDRCLEAYLLAALREAFTLSTSDAAAIASAIPTLHVYGSMGPLPQLQGAPNAIAFGDKTPDLAQAASSIKTYGEGIGNDELATKIDEMVSNSEQLVFLGYSFHPQGIELAFPQGVHKHQQIHATTMGGLMGRAHQLFPGQMGWVDEIQSSTLIDRALSQILS